MLLFVIALPGKDAHAIQILVMGQPGQKLSILLFDFKLLLAHATQRTNPILWEILESNTRLNALFRITNLWIIDPLTYCTDILFHMNII